MNLFYQPSISSGILSPEESRHATKVLRLKAGDEIDITDGKGFFYHASIVNPDFSKCSFKVVSTVQVPTRTYNSHIAIAPTKNTDRIEWFVEKAVELGIDQITFMLCKNSERKTLNMDRIEKLAISALKQSQQAQLPQITPMIPFQLLMNSQANQKFIAFVDSHNPELLKAAAKPGERVLVLIGPEGDFSPDELKLAAGSGFTKVSLGPNRLRTETAGMAACHILTLINS